MSRMVWPSGVDLTAYGNIDFGGATSFAAPSASITTDMFSATAGEALATSKQVHRYVIPYGQASGSDVASATQVVHVCQGAGTIKAIEIVPDTAPTGGDKQFTVNVLNGDASTSYTTVLSSVVTVNSSSTTRTIQAGTISSATVADGDSIQVVITASGSTGSQGQGFGLTITIDEAAA